MVTSIRWSAAQTLAPAAVAILLHRRLPWYHIFWFALSPVVHFLIWTAGLCLMGHAYAPIDPVNIIILSWQHLADTATFSNRFASAWYTWPLLYHPIVVKASYQGMVGRYASSVGNPVYWYLASICVIGLPIAYGLSTLRTRWLFIWRAYFDPVFAKAVLILATGWISLMMLFAVSMGKHSFFYHYQPSYGFAMVLLAGSITRLERHWPRGVLVLVALAFVVALYFAPVWGEFALSLEEANRRMVFPQWRP